MSNQKESTYKCLLTAAKPALAVLWPGCLVRMSRYWAAAERYSPMR